MEEGNSSSDITPPKPYPRGPNSFLDERCLKHKDKASEIQTTHRPTWNRQDMYQEENICGTYYDVYDKQ